MMPVLGQKSRFAVEYSIPKSHGGRWLFGKFCYWCNGIQVGNYELGTSLRDVLFQLERIVGDAGRRGNVRFLDVPAVQVFELLNATLFGPDLFAQTEVANDEQWACNNIVPSVDIFDYYRAFLSEGNESARLIFAHLPLGTVQELFLETGEVDKVLNEVARELGAIYDREDDDA